MKRDDILDFLDKKFACTDSSTKKKKPKSKKDKDKGKEKKKNLVE